MTISAVSWLVPAIPFACIGTVVATFSRSPGRSSISRLAAEPASSSTIFGEPERPICCVLLLDSSRSMASNDWRPSRLTGAKEAAKAFCNTLAESDPGARVAVVSYDSNATTVLGLTPVRDSRTLAKAIDIIRDGGCTNIKAGLQEAIRNLNGQRGNMHVIALSDGHNTEADPQPTAESIKQFATVSTVGIGGSPRDVDEPLLRACASANPDGSKRYRWIGEPGELVVHFRRLAGRIRRA